MGYRIDVNRKENGMNVHWVKNSEVYNNLKIILFHKNVLVRNLKTYLFSMLKILDLSLKWGHWLWPKKL